jgi:hypothetical protein
MNALSRKPCLATCYIATTRSLLYVITGTWFPNRFSAMDVCFDSTIPAFSRLQSLYQILAYNWSTFTFKLLSSATKTPHQNILSKYKYTNVSSRFLINCSPCYRCFKWTLSIKCCALVSPIICEKLINPIGLVCGRCNQSLYMLLSPYSCRLVIE